MRQVKTISKNPVSTAGGAVYHYDDSLLSICERESVFDDKEVYNLARVVGSEFNKRIWIPRNMAPTLGEDLRDRGLKAKFQSSFVPRNPEQERVIKETVAILMAGESMVLQAPTGFGKTMCAMDIIAKVGVRTFIVVTKEDILDQWVDALDKILGLKLGKEVGVVAGDKVDVVGRSVVIGMVQSVAKEGRYSESIFKGFGLAIWDECHRVGADFFSQSCYRLPSLLRLGISATPSRKDGRDEVIAAHIGPIRVKTTSVPLTPRVIIQESPWEIPRKRRVDSEGRVVLNPDGTIDMVQIPHSPSACGHIVKMLTHHHGRNIMIVNMVAQAYQAGRKILIQSDTKDHLATLVMLAGSAGIPAPMIATYVGGMSKAARDKAKTARVIFSTYQMTKEATDIPDLDTLVMATPKSDIEQIVGRILRAFDGKKEPLVFDIVDSTSSVFKSYAKSRLAWYNSRKDKVKIQTLPAPKIDKLAKPTRIAASA